MIAALGNAKQYSVKQYLALAEKLQSKAKVNIFNHDSNSRYFNISELATSSMHV